MGIREVKTGPHLLRGRKQSRKGAYDLVRIEIAVVGGIVIKKGL